MSFQRPHSPYDPPERFLEFIQDRAGDDLANIDDARKGETGEWDYTFSSEAAPTLCNMSNSDTYCGDTTTYNVRNSRAHYYGEQQRRIRLRARARAHLQTFTLTAPYPHSSTSRNPLTPRPRPNPPLTSSLPTLASLYFVDHWAGKVLDKFNDFGYLDNSLVVFVADHGDSLGDHNLWRKGYPTQQVATVPMVSVAWCIVAAQRSMVWHGVVRCGTAWYSNQPQPP